MMLEVVGVISPFNTSLKPHLQKCCHAGIHVIVGTQDLGPRVKWEVPTSMLSMAKIARIELK